MTREGAIPFIILIFLIICGITAIVYSEIEVWKCDWCGRYKKKFKFFLNNRYCPVCKTCSKDLKIKTESEYEFQRVARERTLKHLHEEE